MLIEDGLFNQLGHWNLEEVPWKTILRRKKKKKRMTKLWLNLENGFHEKDYYRGRSPARERDRDGKRDSHRQYRYSVEIPWLTLSHGYLKTKAYIH